MQTVQEQSQSGTPRLTEVVNCNLTRYALIFSDPQHCPLILCFIASLRISLNTCLSPKLP
jgi:hypothetical protein